MKKARTTAVLVGLLLGIIGSSSLTYVTSSRPPGRAHYAKMIGADETNPPVSNGQPNATDL